MPHMIKVIYNQLYLVGWDLRRTLNFFRGIPFFIRDYFKLISEPAFKNNLDTRISFHPCLNDRFDQSGSAKGHYFHQDLLVANAVFNNKPEKHVDIGSRVDGLVAHIASFRPIEVFDIRELELNHSNIQFKQCNLMGDLDEKYHDYADSISCLHALEHFGLGRYGDPIDFDGHIKGLMNIHKILKKDGLLYLSVPIGPQRIEFNAHRVFSLKRLVTLISNNFDIISFSYVDDLGDLHRNADLESGGHNNFNCRYGCGIFVLKKTN